MRTLTLYRTLWGLARNPFPHHAVAAVGCLSDPFYERLQPGLGRRMSRAFIGSEQVPPSIGFLWSLGEGEEAKGYGKTRSLLWFTDFVNTDYGSTASRLAGHEGDGRKVLAAYAAFNTIDGLSLSNLLFDAVRDLLGLRRSLLKHLRDVEIRAGRTKAQIHSKSQQLLERSGERWSPSLLNLLCFSDPNDWHEYINDSLEFSSWHKVRLGRELLRSCVAFLRQSGCEHLIIMVDQVEDFASFATASYKLRRDVSRLAQLCVADNLLRRHVSFVLTLHPRAARVLSRYWLYEELGQLSGADEERAAVRLGPMSKARFPELVKCYLNSARVDGPADSLAPFTVAAIDLIYMLDRGRPGYCLQRLHFLLEAAASEKLSSIERDLVEQLSGTPTEARPQV